MPMKLSRSRQASARPVIGSVEVLEAKRHVGRHHGLGLLGDVGLDGAVFEHGLDDEIGVLQPGIIRRRRDAARARHLPRPAVMRPRSTWLVEQLRRVGLALLGGVLERAVDQHHLDAGHGRHIGDAGAHHARRRARRSS